MLHWPMRPPERKSSYPSLFPSPRTPTMISIPTFIYAAWGVVILLAVIVVCGAFYAGWQRLWGEVFWRKAKVGASVLAMVGIGLLLLNFDISTRAIWKDSAQELLLLEFIEARVNIATSMAALCSETAGLPDGKNTCWDLKNIDGQLSSLNPRDRKHYQHIKHWQNNPRIEEAGERANRQIDWMNQMMFTDADRYQIVPKRDRPTVLFIVAILLVLSTGGSVGEAVFQLRIAKDREAEERDESRPAKDATHIARAADSSVK